MLDSILFSYQLYKRYQLLSSQGKTLKINKKHKLKNNLKLIF